MDSIAIRNERVVLSLEDNFSSGMAKAAAQTALLDRALKNLDGSQVGANRSATDLGKSLPKVGDGANQATRNLDSAGKEIDKLSGRMRILADAAVTIGPALIPIGAAAIPAIVGLTAAFTAAAAGAGVAALAFNGVGDALGAIDKYQLEPTTENLRKVTEELDKIGPAGADFVYYLDSIQPALKSVQDLSRAGLLPGVQDGIEELMTMLPEARTLVFDLATAMGDLSRSAGEGLSGDGFAAFFDYLRSDAARTLTDLGQTIGNITEGFANLMVAFAPLTRQFTGGMESMTASFAEWAAGLSETNGFREFVAYVQENIPRVIDFIGSLASAFTGIITAAAPVGAAVLPALTALADVLGALANSPIGPTLFTAAAGFAAFSRASSMLTTGGSLAKIGTLASTASSGIATMASDLVLLGTTAATAGAKTEREMARVAAASKRANLALAGIGAGVSFVAILGGIEAVQAGFDKLFDTRVDESGLTKNLAALGEGKTVDNLKNVGTEVYNINAAMLQAQDAVFGWLPGDTDVAKAEDNIKKIDAALVSMVKAGDTESAGKAFEVIRKQAMDEGLSAEDFAKSFQGYQSALESVGPAAEVASRATDTYSGSVGRAGIAAGYTDSAVDAMAKAMRDGANAAIGAFDAQTRYAESLAAARKAAENNNAGIRKGTEAGRANRDMLSGLAAAWNGQSEAVKNNNAKFKEARRAFIETATAMGVPKKAAMDLADRLMEIPEKRVINIAMVGDDAARSKINAIKGELASIPRSLSTTYYVNQVNRISRPQATPGSPQGAFADGGYTGAGHKYEPAGIVHRGEVVIPQERVKRDWSMLKARYGDLPGFAGGGMVSADPRRTDARGPKGLPFGMDVDLPRGMGILGKNVKEVNKHLKMTKKALLEEAQERKKSLLDRRNSIKSGISGGLMTDIWAAPSNPWSAGASANPTDALKEITANARKFSALIKSLKGKGVKGAALAEIISSGDVQRAELMNSLSAADLKGFTSALAEARGAVASASNLGASSVIPQRELRQVTKEIRRLQQIVKNADKNNQKGHKDGPRAMGVVINDAAKGGRRRARR